MFKKNKKIKIKKEKSGISEFIKRPLASDDEIEEFEEILSEAGGDESNDEDKIEKEEEIEDSLSEIYQDDDGEMVDVSKLDIKKKRGFFYKFFSFIVTIAIIGGLGYGVYFYITNNRANDEIIEFLVESKESINANEEFFYEINYKNLSNIGIRNIRLEINYPDNYIFLDSVPLADEKNNIWQLDDLGPRERGLIRVKGKIVGKKDSLNKLSANLTYTPENFSSEFKKEAVNTVVLRSAGMNMNFEYSSSVLAGYENEININIKPDNNFMEKFRLVLEGSQNLQVVDLKSDSEEDNEFLIEKKEDNIWELSGLDNKEKDLVLKYKIKEKEDDNEEIGIKFEYGSEIDIFKRDENNGGYKREKQERFFTFYEEKFNFEVVKSDLNLTLLINGSKNDKAVNFGDTLNYSIVYANKGDTVMNDVVIMAVLNGEFLDWTSLKDPKNGEEKGNTISWSKKEIPELESLARNKEGMIDFSINLLELSDNDFNKDLKIVSYAQFDFGEEPSSEADTDEEENDNKSNTIINQINSDLSINQEVRYFDDNNIPVGNGPLPPEVGETSSFKVYWSITNNIHELRDTSVSVSLPDYISWDEKSRASTGRISYNQEEHKVVWQIGRLPVSVFRADAEFNISIRPKEEDRNKIMVLIPGAEVKATDNETGGEIEKKTDPKTTKLEDDEIANFSNDGRIK